MAAQRGAFYVHLLDSKSGRCFLHFHGSIEHQPRIPRGILGQGVGQKQSCAISEFEFRDSSKEPAEEAIRADGADAFHFGVF